MRGADHQQSQMFSSLSPETRVRKDHPLRAIHPMVDEVLTKLSRRFDSMYASIFQQPAGLWANCWRPFPYRIMEDFRMSLKGPPPAARGKSLLSGRGNVARDRICANAKLAIRGNLRGLPIYSVRVCAQCFEDRRCRYGREQVRIVALHRYAAFVRPAEPA